LRLFIRSFRYWLPTLLWLGVIAYESFRLSSSVTGSWLWHILQFLHVRFSAESFAALHHLLRKAGHLTGYGLLCVLLFRSWFHTLSNHKGLPGTRQQVQESTQNSLKFGLRRRTVALALSMTLITAMLDEWHQSFDFSRTGTPWDVVIDFAGGVCFLWIALFGLKLWQTQHVEKLQQVSA